MPDRAHLLDAVCGRCKRIVRREDSVDEDLTQQKDEIVADGLIPYDYFTDDPKPVTGHANNCPKRPQ